MEDILIKYKPDIVHYHNSKKGVTTRVAVKNMNKNKSLHQKWLLTISFY